MLEGKNGTTLRPEGSCSSLRALSFWLCKKPVSRHGGQGHRLASSHRSWAGGEGQVSPGPLDSHLLVGPSKELGHSRLTGHYVPHSHPTLPQHPLVPFSCQTKPHHHALGYLLCYPIPCGQTQQLIPPSFQDGIPKPLTWPPPSTLD